jgi:hypothetical protein
MVLRNPNGSEIKVRALRIAESTTTVVVSDSEFVINIATCELDKPLAFDILGAPVQRQAPSANNAATVFSTAPAVGARFHGVKPLASAITLGAQPIRKVNVAGGIFSQLVPASTVPTPVVDQFPLVERPTLSRTATAPISLSTAALTLGPNTVLQLPTAVEPGSLTMTHGATAFTSTAAGQVLQGSTLVGNVDATGRTLTMLSTSPAYGSATNTISYKPATVTGATAHSNATLVTDANRSTALVRVLEPPPAPGTLTVSYMSQGRWYELVEDGTGKLSGADTSYGAGTLSFVTGSLSAGLGAQPDVDSMIVYTWGEAASAVTATGAPARAWADLPLTRAPQPGTLSLAWTRGGVNHAASVNASGVVTGAAQIRPAEVQPDGSYLLPFSPDVLPDGPVTATYNALANLNAFTNNGGGSYTLTSAPVAPGTVRFRAIVTVQGVSKTVQCYSAGTEVFAQGVGLIGTINNTTGAMVLSVASQNKTVYTRTRYISNWGIDPVTREEGNRYFYITSASTVAQNVALNNITTILYQPTTAPAAQNESAQPVWVIEAQPPQGLSVVTTGLAFVWAGALHFAQAGTVFRGWHSGTGVATAVGAVDTAGRITLGNLPPGASNAVIWSNLAHDQRGSLDVLQGVFRVPVAPIQAGQFQLQSGSLVASANSGGVLSGDFVGAVDSLRGVVTWAVTGVGPGENDGAPVRADEITYNAVYLQFVPLDSTLLGVDTAGLPSDGRVQVFRAGEHVVVHHTAVYTLPNPVVKGTAYPLGRARVSSVVLRDAVGTRLPGTLYDVDRNAGTITVKTAADITPYALPLAAEHRVQDELQVLSADISGELLLAGALTHNYPLGSFVSGKLRQGDKFARVFGYADRTTWQNSWTATAAGSDIGTASYNSVDYPIATTNRGAITERWAAIFVNTTQVRVVGEGVGQVLTAQPIASAIEAINPQTNAPYFTIPAAGWGGGWSAGNVLLFETQAAGAPVWVARSVQPGGTEVLDDSAAFAYIANVDTP